MHFAPGAARLDVGEHALEIAHAAGQLLHFAQALLHGLQALAHQFERLAQAFLERALQLFINGVPHLVEFLRVALLHFAHALVERAAQLVEPLAVTAVELADLVGDAL